MGWLTRQSLGRYLSVRTKGLEHVPDDGSFILASNHKSTLDPILLVAFTIQRTAVPVAPAATKGLFVGPLGWFLRGLGAIEIDRVKNRNTASVRRLLRQLECGPVLIFPEGGIHPGEGVRAAKFGVGYLARRASVPVVPVAVIGSDHSLPKGGRRLRRRSVTLNFGNPIAVDHNDSDQDVTDRVMDSVSVLYRAD